MAIAYVDMLEISLTMQDEESETILGEWMAERGNRDRLIVATKYTSE
jgi:aryl-alcohol dehydrogenase-like predicted oxidoreductase